MSVTASPMPAATSEPESGVIEEARRRRRRRRARRSTAAAVAVAVAIGGALALGSERPGARPRRPHDPRGSGYALPHSTAQALRDLIVLPSISAGYAGLCEHEFSDGGSCGAGYWEAGRPLFGDGGYVIFPGGRVPAGGRYYFVLTSPAVAAVRVSDLGNVATMADPGRIPNGDRVAIFHLRAGTRGTVIPPGATAAVLDGSEQAKRSGAITMTPVDRSGHPLRQVSEESVRVVRGEWTRYWQRAEPIPHGVCAVTMSRLPGVRARFGVVSTAVGAQPQLGGTAFFSCLDTYYSTPGAGVFVSVFLDAQHPGARPSALWGTAVPGHPGLLEVGGVRAQPEPGGGLAGEMTARRERDVWLAVQGGTGLAQRIEILSALRLTRAP
jgi:hypothetical protein